MISYQDLTFCQALICCLSSRSSKSAEKLTPHPQCLKSEQDLCSCSTFLRPANTLSTICGFLIMACKIFHLDISWHMLSGSTCLSYSNKSKAKTWKVITSKTYMLDSSVRSCFLSNQPLTVWALCGSEISLQDVATVWWEKQIGCLLMRNVVENEFCKASPKLVQSLTTFFWITSSVLAGVMTRRWQSL